ncbi:hypothetical protein GBF35_23135 [Nonomuraea phyllanthi]|nr:hypothetical protein GBF35_23135 [Nonomuraea phyllanthi]
MKLDITTTNQAIERLLETTENPRHRFLLQAYHRHRYLEIAGRYEEIFAPDMMVEDPVYHFHALGINTTLEGQDAIRNLYRTWSETGECVKYTDDENAMYIYKAREEMVWPYDDRGRLIGEDVWEVDPGEAEIIELDPADVITTREAAEILNPLIKPLPAFDETVMGVARSRR